MVLSIIVALALGILPHRILTYIRHKRAQRRGGKINFSRVIYTQLDPVGGRGLSNRLKGG